MVYEINILRRAQKELFRIKGNDYHRIKTAINDLAINPRPSGCKRLTGHDDCLIRVGDYRIIYEINDKELVILIVHIGNRKDVYRLS